MKQITRLLLILVLTIIPLLPRSVSAASATLYLSPASGSVLNGDTISIQVRVNSGSDNINAVQANLSYPTNMFDFVSITSSSAFGIAAESYGANGSVRIGRGALPSVNGDQLVATVAFRANAGSGTANVAFAAGSAVSADDGNGTNILTGTSGGSYTLTSPPTPPPPPPPPPSPSPSPGPSPSPSPSPGPSPSPSPSTKPSPTPSTKPSPSPSPTPGSAPPPAANNSGLTITDVSVSKDENGLYIVSWVSSKPASSEVNYGPDVSCGKDKPKYFLTATDGALVTNHKVSLSQQLLTSGPYRFIAKSTDAAGNVASSADGTFNANTVQVIAKVINQENKLVKGAKVTLGCSSGTTDKNGQATLNDVAALPQIKGTVEHNGKRTPVLADTASNAASASPQQLTFKIKTSANPLVATASALGALALILFGAGYLIRRHNMRLGLKPGPISDTPLEEKIVNPSTSQTPSAVIKPTAPPPDDPTKLQK